MSHNAQMQILLLRDERVQRIRGPRYIALYRFVPFGTGARVCLRHQMIRRETVYGYTLPKCPQRTQH